MARIPVESGTEGIVAVVLTGYGSGIGRTDGELVLILAVGRMNDIAYATAKVHEFVVVLYTAILWGLCSLSLMWFVLKSVL